MFNPEKMGQSSPQESLPQQEKLPESFDIRIKSLASEGHPDRNEDAIFMRKDKKALGVLDGMGGHAAGDVASGEARNYIAEALQKLSEGLSLQQTQAELEMVLRETNERLLQVAEKNPALKGMGTTASIVKIWEGIHGERKAVIANVGDSRVYILRADGKLEQVTLDDNIVSSVIKDERQARILQEKLNNVTDPSTLSPQEQMLFNRRNEISQALGMRDIKPHISAIDVRDGEKLIVTSDGIHDNLTDAEIAQILAASENNQKAVENLTNSSRNRSREQHPRAKADDMSAIVVEFPSPVGGKKIEQVPTPKPVERQEKARLHKGDIVRVQRSSGEIESDWEIFGFDQKTGNAIVRKAEKGKILEKRIPQTELKNLNPPERKISISEAKDFTELFKAIEATGGLQGSEKFYEVAELKHIVNRVRTGELTLDILTRTGGLRGRVKDLLKIKEIRKKIEASGTEKDRVFQNLERLASPFKSGEERMYSGGGREEIFRFGKFIDGVESLIQSSITKEEAKRLLSLIRSFPAGTHDMKDVERLKPLQEVIERMAW